MDNKKQNIKCNVYSCKYCNCDSDMCNLDEIKVTNQCGKSFCIDDTVCSSYKCDKGRLKD